MNMKTKITALAFLAVTAGVFFFTRTTNVPPSDLRDAAAEDVNSHGFTTAIPVVKKDEGNIPVPTAVPVKAGAPGISKGYVVENNPVAVVPSTPMEWITISGGKFTMGSSSVEKCFENAKPIHEVAIKTFEMSKTAVTVEQYAECVLKGQCTTPDVGNGCNWHVAGRQLHPINCVTWDQAKQYAKFRGGGARLPSESEWEYAATSGGKNQKYPWGNEAPASDKAVMGPNSWISDGTMPVCSKIAGNTAQGLCDMAGNVWQWVRDTYRNSYKDAPADGSAFEGAGRYRVIRGCAAQGSGAGYLRADYRSARGPGHGFNDVGFRLARSSR